MKKIIAIVLVGLFFTANSFGGVFGLKMGMTIDEIDKNAKKLAENVYSVSVPDPHSAFNEYIVATCPSQGLYLVKGIGKTINTNVYGDEVKSTFNTMEKKLKKAYGKNKKYDFIKAESLWEESKYWMMGLLKKDRSLSSLWMKEYKSKLKDNILAIGLTATALSQNSAYLTLEYNFENFDACHKENASKEDTSL